VRTGRRKWWIDQRCLSLCIVLFSLTGCQSERSTLHPGGPAAGNIAWLEWTALIAFCIISFIMWILLLWAVTRKRGSLETHEPWNTTGGQGWIAIGGFAIPFVVLCSLFVLGLLLLRSFPIHEGAEVHPEIQVIGHQWWWEVHYIANPASRQFTTANEIHIPVGRPIDIELDGSDVIHSFWVPRLHGKVDLFPGQRNYIRIQANSPGNYGGQCAEYCGEQHAHMLLLVVAQTPQDYEAWYNNQLSPARNPQGAEAIHGRDVFLGAACVFCHEIRGTDAHGHVAPDLTHLASRQRIASDSYENNKANLAGWVVHAQTLKPGNEMPNLAVFDGQDLRALVAYLQELQ
jgi:cytochrome c oxidase subunit II